MKQQYFGDINDYLKYGLLRCFAAVGVMVGVCWMLTPDDGRTDGGKTDYLRQPERWRGPDPELFDALTESVLRMNERDVRHAEQGLFLPKALFFGDVVPEGKNERALWFRKAEVALAGTELVFFDPDNGIEVMSKPRGRKGSSKYVYWDELVHVWERGASLLVFQHFAREKRDSHVLRLSHDLARRILGARVVSIRSSNVLFLLACHELHRSQADEALIPLNSRWSGRLRIDDMTHAVG